MNDEQNNEDNVVDFKAQSAALRKQKAQAEKAASKAEQSHEPMFNIPPGVMALVIVLAVPFLALKILESFYPGITEFAYMHFGFVPASWSGGAPFGWASIITPISFNLLHGGWLHFGMNITMLIAFGAGVEKAFGGLRLWVLFILTSMIGAFCHTLFYADSLVPIVGASGGISGLFGAVLIIMMRSGMMPSRYGIWPFVILWVGISIVFGVFTPIGGAKIAWVAHIGGFLGGLLLMRLRWFSHALLR